jgi:hypothetical protein
MRHQTPILVRNLTNHWLDLIVEHQGDSILLTIRPKEGQWMGTVEPGGGIRCYEGDLDHTGGEPDAR